MVRTRSRIDVEERTQFGALTEEFVAHKYTGSILLPYKGPWSIPDAGLSGYDLQYDAGSREAIKTWMVANWKKFAHRTVVTDTVAVGYSQLGQSVITDTPTPNFKKLSAQGVIINNAYSRTKLSLKSSLVEEVDETEGGSGTASEDWKANGLLFYVDSQYGTRKQVSFSCPPEVVKILQDIRPVASGRQTAINNAYGNIQQGEVELLVIAAEGRKTVQHLVSVVFRFAKLVRALKTGNFKDISPKTWKKWKSGSYGKGASIKDTFSDAWMEARYAWVPTIMDAIGAMNILTGNVERRLTFRGKESEAYMSEIDMPVKCALPNVRLKAVVFGDVATRAGVLTAARIHAQSMIDTGVFNIATAVKEMIPFSFVLEWFVNLSGLLYHLNPNPMLAPLAAWATDKSDLQVVGHVEWERSPGEIISVPLSCTLSSTDRVPIDGPGLLTIDVNLGIARIIDGAILLLRSSR